MKIIFIDTETTGLSADNNDVVQIAGYVTENRKVLDSFNLKCQPLNWGSIHPKAVEVTHPHQTYAQVIAEFKTYDHPTVSLETLKGIFDKHKEVDEKFIFAGQNTPFDWRFLVAFWSKNNRNGGSLSDYFNTSITYDLMDLTKPLKNMGILNVPNVKLGTIVEALDIKVNGELHDALTDIDGTYKSFYKMADQWLQKMNDINVRNKMSVGIRHFFESEGIKIP
jgi:DNA polymerase III alpha subunit (gram-positive type)